ncbi:MAG: DUF938 domain-containing protein, partial [Alcanivoracaceae bacterium]|nr:DUF938 domain-containing protein [Alcanivoracaceae bacterium]
MDQLPFSQACENNRKPIGAVLARHIKVPARLLEIGSGTGQHGYYFSESFPGLQWQPSDCAENLPIIRQWVEAAGRDNYAWPLLLDVAHPQLSAQQYDYLFSANTLHIMAWAEVEAFFRLVPQMLRGGGLLIVYGPFNYGGAFTSESNARFDQLLKSRAPHQGI